MNVQVTASHSDFNVFKSRSRHSTLRVAPPDVFTLRTEALKLSVNGAPFFNRKILPNSYLSSSYKRCPPVCLFGGKGRPDNGDEASPWKSIEKGMGNLKKEQSVEDALRQQIEDYDDGGSGGNRSGGGGGGGRGGSGGSGDGGFWGNLDELLQVILATTGLITVYFYLLYGEDWPYIVRDYIKAFIFLRKKSYRVRRNMEEWAKRYKVFKEKVIKPISKAISEAISEAMYDDNDGRICYPPHLSSVIVNTPTWWNYPYLHEELLPEDDDQLVIEEPLKSKEDGNRNRYDPNKESDDESGSDKDKESDDESGSDKDKESDDESDKEEVDDEESDDEEEEVDDDDDSDKEFFDELEKENEGSDKEEEEDDYFEPYLIGDEEEEEEGKEEDLISQLHRIDMGAVERIAGEVSSGEEDDDGVDYPVKFTEEELKMLKPKVRRKDQFTRRLSVRIKRKKN